MRDKLSQRECKEIIKERANVDHLIEKTTIFHDPIGEKPLDKYTVEHVKSQIKMYFWACIDEAVDTLK